MPDWWNKLSHLLVLISRGRWNWNSMREKFWLPRHVRSRKRDEVMWHKCYPHRNKVKNSSLGTANRSFKTPCLVAAKNAKQSFRKSVFFQNKERVDIFSVQTFQSSPQLMQCRWIFMRKGTIVQKFEEESIGHLYSCFHLDTVRKTERYALNLCQ